MPEAISTDKSEGQLSGKPEVLYAEQAAEKTREAAKWIVAAFGALAAALVAGVSIKDLSSLSDDGIAQATLGLFAALVGALLVVVPVGRVLSSGRVSVSEVGKAPAGFRFWLRRRQRDAVESETALLSGFTSLAALVDKHELFAYEQVKWFNEIKGLPASPQPAWISSEEAQLFETVPGDLDDAAKAKTLFDRAKSGLLITNTATGQVAEFLSAATVRQRFRRALWPLAVGVLIAGLGAVLFASAETLEEEKAAEAKSTPAIDVEARPVAAQLVIDEEASDVYQALLGEDCALDEIAVAVIGTTDEAMEVVVLPQDGCQMRRLSVANDEGAVVAAPDLACVFEPPDPGVRCP